MHSPSQLLRQRICRGHVEIACYLAIAAFFAGWALLGKAEPVQKRPPARTSTAAGLASGPKSFATRPIEAIQVGDRTLGENPQLDQVDASLPEPDPAAWSKVSLHLVKQNGRNLWVDFLRPNDWFDDNQVKVGGHVWLDLPEMGAVGNGEVLSVEPCPPIKPGKGHVVTGTFKHETDKDLVQLRLEGQSEATGVTENHPYWSEDRQQFIPAGELRQGERVNAAEGPVRVESISRVAYAGTVHNLEVHGEHVYRVGSIGALVHNSCITKIRFRGAIGIDSLRAATHQDITKAFAGTGFKPSGQNAMKLSRN